MSGLWLQGAEWDYERNLIVEPTTPHVFQEFPVIKCVTQHREDIEESGGYLDSATLHQLATDQFNDIPEPTGKEKKMIKKLREAKKKRALQGGRSTMNLIDENEEHSPRQAKSGDGSQKSEAEEEDEDEDGSMLEELENKTYYYSCPVFQTTLRLNKDLEY